MTSISQNMFIDNLDDIVNNYNSTYCRTIKMKPVDVKPNTYIDSSKEINDKDPKFKIGDMSKYVFAKGYVPNLSEEVFAIKKLGTLCRGHMLLVILKKKKLLELFVKKNCKKDK